MAVYGHVTQILIYIFHNYNYEILIIRCIDTSDSRIGLATYDISYNSLQIQNDWYKLIDRWIILFLSQFIFSIRYTYRVFVYVFCSLFIVCIAYLVCCAYTMISSPPPPESDFPSISMKLWIRELWIANFRVQLFNDS